MHLERAVEGDLDAIYQMGFDAWGAAMQLDAYLAVCRASPKYAQGRWFVLRDDVEPVCAALAHDFPAWNGRSVRGVGSLATSPAHRRRGHGGRLLNLLASSLLSTEDAAVVFLYSDIDPTFYEKLGFHKLHERHQRHPGSVLLARVQPTLGIAFVEEHDAELPSYF